MTPIYLSDAEREHLGKAAYRGLYDLNDDPPADVDRDWDTMRIRDRELAQEDFAYAGIEAVNSLLAMPKGVRERVAAWLLAYGEGDNHG